jgi:uncharacterized protein YydD (DUF2326 family)
VIREVHASHPSFHSVIFEPGMNLVLADVTPASGEKDTRNGVGKTSLLEIIHFCLGSSPAKNDTLKHPALSEWSFSLTLDVGPEIVTVRRGIGQNRVLVSIDGQEQRLSLGEWKDRLGRELFDLAPRAPEDPIGPSFRSLVSYVARRDRYAYDHPFDHHAKTPAWDRQVNMGYLLGLGWRDAAAFETLRRRETWLKHEKEAAKQGFLAARPRHRGRLEAERVRLEEALRSLTDELAAFRVHPEYARIEDEANTLTREIQALVNENVADKNILGHYRDAVAAESAPDAGEIAALFAAANVELPGAVRRSLNELETFHRSLIANRRTFLATEIRAIEQRIAEREPRSRALSEQRAARLEILRSHGALEEYTRLSARLTERKEQLARTEAELAAIDRLEEGTRALKTDALDAYDRARLAHDERLAQRQRAISLFNAYSKFLYDEPGNLILEVKQGKRIPTLELDVEIVRSKATGIEHMKTLCLDLTIAALWADRSKRPGFLIHDSALFDGVDERQRALALELCERESRERGYQYILALNTDQLPPALPDGFDPKRYERLRLADEPPEASLLGTRF